MKHNRERGKIEDNNDNEDKSESETLGGGGTTK